MRKLIIHAGIHRTGTTSIQSALASNRGALRESGYLYPGEKSNHQDWAWGLISGKRSPEEFVGYLRAELSDDIHTVIISGEDFCIHKDLSWVKVLSGDFDVSVRIFTRRQDDWLMSWYNQHVKWPWDRAKSVMTPDEFLRAIDDFYWIDFEWLASNWGRALGNDKVRLTPMAKDQTAAFLAEVAPGVSLVHPARSANESVPTSALDVLRHINAVNPAAGLKIGPPARHRIIRSILQFSERERVDPVFSDEQRRAIRDRYSASNAAVSERFLGGQPAVGPEREISGAYTPLSEQEIIALMSKIIINLAKSVQN